MISIWPVITIWSVIAMVAFTLLPIDRASASTADDLAAATAAIDELAERFFAAQREAAAIERDIAAIEQRQTSIAEAARDARRHARAEALALYQGAGSGGSVSSLLGGRDVMDTARRSTLLRVAGENSRGALDRYAALTREGRDALADLEARRAHQAEVVAGLAQDEQALQARLADLQARYQQEQRAAAEAEAAAALAARAAEPATTDGTSPDNGGTSTTNPPRPDPIDPPPPPEPGVHPHHDDPFLSCVRQRESRGVYTAVNPAGYYGAYQFASSTWDATAAHAGRPALIGVRPDRASPWDQDDLAWVLYQWQGMAPWGGGCG